MSILQLISATAVLVGADAWTLGDRAPEISVADKVEQEIVPVPAAAPLLLSALAGFLFAASGRRNRV